MRMRGLTRSTVAWERRHPCRRDGWSRTGRQGCRRSQVKADAPNQAGVFIGFSGMTYQAGRFVDYQQFAIFKEDVKKVLHKQLLFQDDSPFRERYASDLHKRAAMNERQTHVNRSLRPALGVILIFLVVLAAYWPALQGQFVWDDELLVAKNPLVTGKLTLRSVWFGTDFPLSLTALWLEWLAWDKHPAGYHAVNILLHVVGTVLLWRVLLRLKIPGAWLAALIFAVHPVCAGSVAWISALKNTLSLGFYPLRILWYLRFH